MLDLRERDSSMNEMKQRERECVFVCVCGCVCVVEEQDIHQLNTLTFHDRGYNLGPNPILWPTILYSNQMVCLHHRIDDSVTVERPQRTKVDHFTAYATLGKNIGSFKCCDQCL